MATHTEYWIEMRQTESRGRGIFALKDFHAGELIETVPVIVIPPKQRKLLDKTIIYSYYFAWGEDQKGGAIALGNGSIYNHSYSPNARYFKDEKTAMISFRAHEEILSGSEITVNYGGAPDSKESVWFPLAT